MNLFFLFFSQQIYCINQYLLNGVIYLDPIYNMNVSRVESVYTYCLVSLACHTHIDYAYQHMKLINKNSFRYDYMIQFDFIHLLKIIYENNILKQTSYITKLYIKKKVIDHFSLIN